MLTTTEESFLYFRKQVDHGMRLFTGSQILFLLCIDTKARNWFWIFVKGARGELGFIQHTSHYSNSIFLFSCKLDYLLTGYGADRVMPSAGFPLFARSLFCDMDTFNEKCAKKQESDFKFANPYNESL